MNFKIISLISLLCGVVGLAFVPVPFQIRSAGGVPTIKASKEPTGPETENLLFHGIAIVPAANKGTTVDWNGSQDQRWSNPANWQSGRVPGISDVARFSAGSSSVAFDSATAALIAGLILERDYGGTVTLASDLAISGDLVIAGGVIDQRNYDLSVDRYRQSGGTFTGGDGGLMIQRDAVVSGGKLLGSKSMTAGSLTINSPAVVTMAVNSKLNLTGDGEPLSGNGVLDVTTNGPNSLEYTGRATSDVTTAGPLKGALRTAVSAQSPLPFAMQGSNRQLGSDPVRSRIDSSLLGLTPLEPSRAFGNQGRIRSEKTSLIQSLSPQLPNQALPGSFSRSAALKLTQNEVPNAVALDTVNGFAYFGTSTSVGPGAVVKVRLSDGARVGALVLTGNDDAPSSAVIDTAGGFVYFGGYNGDITKVRLSDFTRVAVIETGTGFQYAAVIDTNNGFAYFGSFTNPGGVFKVRLSDFTIVDVLLLNTDEIGILSGAIDTVNGFAYFGTYNQNNINNPTFIVKVRLSDFTRVGNLQLPAFPTGMNPTCAVIDTANGYGYFGLFESHNIIKVRLSDLTLVGTLISNDRGVQQLRSAVIDTINGYAYFGDAANKVLKLRLSDFSVAEVLAVPSDNLFCAAIDSTNGFVYFGGSIPQGVVKVRLSDFSAEYFKPFSFGEDNLTAAVIDPGNGFAYFATGRAPGVVKVRLSDFTRVGVLTLPPEDSRFATGVIDTANGYAYFATDGTRANIVKIQLSDFTRVSALRLNSGEGNVFSSAIDPANGFAYFGSTNSPGQVYKVRLSDFTRVSALTFAFNERARSMVIDTINGFAYFGSYGGFVVKFRLSDFTRIGVIRISEDDFLSAVADPVAGFAYFGSFGGSVFRVRLSDFSGAGAVSTSEQNFQSAAIDTVNGNAYFGTLTSPGRIAKIHLSDFTRVDGLTLNAGEDYLRSAVLDTANGFGYFGTGTQPGIVVRVQLGGATPTPTPLPNINISGRVVTPSGSGLRGASVRLTDKNGDTLSVWTGSLGYFAFENIPVGHVSIAVVSRRYRFEPWSASLVSSTVMEDMIGIE